MKEKSSAKKKWENIWYYYKIHIIAAVFVVFLIVSFVYEKVTATKYDYNVALVCTESITFEDEEILIAALESCADDRDGNGEVKVQLLSYIIENGDDADATQVMAAQTQLTGDLQLNTSIIYIYSDQIYEQFKDEGLFPEDEAERFRLSDSSQELSDSLNELNICVLDYSRIDESDEETVEYYYDSLKLFEWFLK